MKPVKVGICGLGTVGSGTFNILTKNAAEIARRAGRDIEIACIGTRAGHPDCDTTGYVMLEDKLAIAQDPEVDIVVELIGGCDLAFDIVMTAIQQGKHVVTANKALIAERGNEIFAAAKERDVIVAFEASVAGGIPIIKSIREGLAANKIHWLAGIINGTGNFILTEMRDKGRDFADVLQEAQALGYAEADPTFDVEGIDAAHKLTILASIAFGIPLQFDKVYTEGISRITQEDVCYAEELGYRIKHLGVARKSNLGIELRVHPTLIPASKLLANVNGVMNAVMVAADSVKECMFYGPGAGSLPTASAVVADILDIARVLDTKAKHHVPSLGFQSQHLSEEPVISIDEAFSAYYLRLQAQEKPGVLSNITRILGEKGINIEAIIQKETHQSEVPVILVTQPIREALINEAIEEIEALDVVQGQVFRLRIEHLQT